jgi:tetratricopeptide (TPR) repeat protein
MSQKNRKKVEASQAVVVTVGRGPRKRFILKLALLSVVVILACTAAAYLFKQDHDTAAKVTPAVKRAETLKDVAKLNDSKNYTQEAAQLQTYLDSNPPAEYASKEIVRMAAAYINAKDYDNAIKTLETARDKYPDSRYAAIRGLAFAHMMRGDEKKSKEDYRKAIDYFKQSIAIESASPEMAHVVGSDETNIRYLEDKLR